jgi:hypothetical protein
MGGGSYHEVNGGHHVCGSLHLQLGGTFRVLSRRTEVPRTRHHCGLALLARCTILTTAFHPQRNGMVEDALLVRAGGQS